jgi:cytochrome c oxidase assembly factor CtaG
VLALALALIALVPGFWSRSFAAHMGQHLLLNDAVPLLLLPALRLRVLVHPALALPLWLADLYLWHVPATYDAALRHGALHWLAHLCLLGFGLAMWAPLLGSVRTPPSFGSGARLLYLAAMQVGALVLANVLLWWGAPLYDRYGLHDQRVGGGLLLVEGSAIFVAVAAWLVLGLLREEPRSA